MASPPKPKSGKSDSSRSNTGRRGSKKTRLTELEKILMGGGVLRNVGKNNDHPKG